MQRTTEVMGPRSSWNLSGTFVDSPTNGSFARLTYSASFANGPATTTNVMKGNPEANRRYQVHSFNIASPLFDQTIPCPGCSYPCDPGTRFCPKCGAALQAEDPGTIPPQP